MRFCLPPFPNCNFSVSILNGGMRFATQLANLTRSPGRVTDG
jgi:hypothetical protein